MNPLLNAQAEPLPGYRLIERLGRGGYGEVWKAEAPGGLFKAIKFVYGDLNNASEDAKPAEQELKALNRVKTIRHPYILSLERFDIVDGQLLIVMELADRNLWDRFQECRGQGLAGIPQDELMRYLDEIAEALDLMNGHYQIQHLDIKPQNLFLVHNHIKVADFGLAKDFEGIRATVTGGVTPVYAAPETFEGWISRFSDQYSLAIVYQELLTGVRPFSGTNTRHLLMQHLSAPPDVSPLPLPQREVIARALSKKPDERFPTCRGFVQALHDSLYEHGDAAGQRRRPSPAQDAHSNFNTPATVPAPPPSTLTPSATKGLPRLITPGTGGPSPSPRRTSESAPVTQLRPVTLETPFASDPSAGIPELVGEGVLYPVYAIGLGLTGLRVLRRLRAQVHERTGQASLPHWKWLYIDTDANGIQTATAPDGLKSLATDEVYHARMQRPAYYLKSHSLPSVDQWMSSEMLYRIPREPATEGIRTLGRLALLDHYGPIVQKIRHDLEAFLSNAPLQEADRLLKVGIRSNCPRVYLATSLCGGTGSGMLVDLAYIVRQELRKVGFTKTHLTAALLVPAVEKGTPKTLALANACAALAEIDHFSRPGECFQARFDSRQPAVVDTGVPFDRCVVMTLPKGPRGRREPPVNAERMAGLICQESLAPLGPRIDEVRAAKSTANPRRGLTVQSFGYCRLVWPRRRLVDVAAQRFAGRMLQRWSEKESLIPADRLAAEFEDFWRRSQFDRDSIRSAVEQALAEELQARLEEIVDAELRPFHEESQDSQRSDQQSLWQAVEQIIQLLGNLTTAEDKSAGRLRDLLDEIARTVGKEASVRFAKMAIHFAERPDCRFAAADAAVKLCTDRLERVIGQLQRENVQLGRQVDEEFQRILSQIAAMMQAMPGTADRRRTATLVETAQALAAWARRRIEWHLARPVINVYRRMLANAPEYVREMSVSRQKIAELAAEMQRAAEADASSAPLHDVPILPPDTKNLLQAADRLVDEVPVEKVRAFENDLQLLIRKRLEGLVSVCLSYPTNGPRLRGLVLQECREMLDGYLGAQTVAEVFFRNQPDAQAAHRAIMRAYEDAEPEQFGPAVKPESQTVMLAAADDDWGRRFKDAARELVPEQEIIEATAADEIVFLRECHHIRVADLPQAGALAADAVKTVTMAERTSVFSRTDIAWKSFLKG